MTTNGDAATTGPVVAAAVSQGMEALAASAREAAELRDATAAARDAALHERLDTLEAMMAEMSRNQAALVAFVDGLTKAAERNPLARKFLAGNGAGKD